MVTDEIMEMLSRLEDLLNGHLLGTGVTIAADALAAFSEDGWRMMSATERDRWLCDVVARHYTAK